jgi:hypothetical protein
MQKIFRDTEFLSVIVYDYYIGGKITLNTMVDIYKRRKKFTP